MELSVLVTNAMEAFSTLFKNKVVGKIIEDFSEATQNDLIALWEKMKPIFIEQIGDDTAIFENNPENLEAKGAIASELRKIIKKDTELQTELLNILTKNIPSVKKVSNNISNSGNNNVFVQGSEIKGNINIGNSTKD
jgi:hypothetical protein